MIKSKRELDRRALEVDLTGPEGNVFAMIGLARRLAKQLDKDADEIAGRMCESDYDNLIKVFEEEFGNFVTLYR